MRLAIALAALAAFSTPTFAQDGSGWPVPEVSSDISALPKPVQAKLRALINAAASGDIEALRPIIEAQASPPTVSFGLPDDPIAYLKDVSEDDDGRQMLGLLLDLFDQPYAYYPNSGGETYYLWPYVAEFDPNALTPEQTVDAYRLLNTAQLEELKELGSWYYWRTTISASGEWSAFVAGD